MENTQYLEEDKIDLRELFSVLQRRQKLIWSVTVLFTLLALVYVLVAKPLYRAETTISIGSEIIESKSGSLSTKYFEESKGIKEILDIAYDTAGKYRDKNSTAHIDKISIPKEIEGILTFSAEGESNGKAVEISQNLIDTLMKKHQIYFQSIVDKRTHAAKILNEKLRQLKIITLPKLKKELDHIKEIDLKKIEESINLTKQYQIPAFTEKIEKSRSEISKKEADIQKMKKELTLISKKDPVLATMTTMQVSNLQNSIERLSIRVIDYQLERQKLLTQSIPDLEKKKKRIIEKIIPEKEAAVKTLNTITIPDTVAKLEEAKSLTKPPYIKMTEVIGEIKTHEYPVKPKKKLILVVGFITGLMLSVFLAFFLEFLQGLRREEETA